MNGPPVGFCPSPEPSSPYSGSPERSPSNRASTKRDAPFLEPSNYLLKFPVNRLPRFSNGPLRIEAPISRSFFYAFLSKSLVNEPPSMFPNRVSTEREAPIKEPSHEKQGKHEPHVDGRPTYRCGLVPQGDCLIHCSLYFCAMQPSAQYLPPWLG